MFWTLSSLTHVSHTRHEAYTHSSFGAAREIVHVPSLHTWSYWVETKMRLADGLIQSLSSSQFHLPEARKTDGKVACWYVVLDVARFGAEDGICCYHT